MTERVGFIRTDSLYTTIPALCIYDCCGVSGDNARMLCSLIVVRKPENLTSRRELDVIPAQKDTVGLRVLRGGGFRGPWVLGPKRPGIRVAKRP